MHCDDKRYIQLQLVTNQELLASYQRLHARHGTCTKKEFAQWQQATGLTYSKYALMLNQDLLSRNLAQPVSQFCHDWTHGVLQGTAPIVLHHTLQAIAAEGFEVYPYLEKYFQPWQYPQHQKCQYVHVLFQAKNMKSKESHEIQLHCFRMFGHLSHHQALCGKGSSTPRSLSKGIDSFSSNGISH